MTAIIEVRTIRWPVAPLLATCRVTTIGDVAALVGVSTRTVHRWQRNGLTDTQADRAAVALGLHPANVWPDWWSR